MKRKMLIALIAAMMVCSLPLTAFSQSRRARIVNRRFDVGPGSYIYVPFHVPNNGGILTGRFNSRDINFWVLDEAGFTDFSNGGYFNAYQTLRRVSVGIISARLPPGGYYMIFDNQHASIMTKSVTVIADVVF